MKALKSHPQIERPHCMKSRISHAKQRANLALTGLISVVMLMLEPVALAQLPQVDSGWIPTGNLIAARYDHTATLLANGKVLVVGGRDRSNNLVMLNSAELYDPDTGTWSITGNLNTPRSGHTATLLQNGKVLVGGGTAIGVMPNAELYDPATGTWSITGNLITTRFFHTATLLQNGKVLVAGGTAGVLPNAELYDPDTGTWSVSGNLDPQLKGTRSRAGHTATLLPNGKVLVAGGFDENDPNFTDPYVFSSAELYDPDTGTWSITGDLNTWRDFHTATLLQNGKVLVVGAFRSNSSELYDPATGQWKLTGNLITGRYYGHTATLLPNGKLLVAGGATGFFSDILNASELYDPTTGTWSVTGNLSTRRSGHTATLLPNGKVLVAGDYAGSLNSAELYDPDAPIAIPKIIGASVSGKKLFVLGDSFDPGAVILLNGEEQKTKNDGQNPETTLIGKKAGKKIKPGDKLQVRNPNGTLSEEFTFPGS